MTSGAKLTPHKDSYAKAFVLIFNFPNCNVRAGRGTKLHQISKLLNAFADLGRNNEYLPDDRGICHTKELVRTQFQGHLIA